jgi:serine/threonine protein kinase
MFLVQEYMNSGTLKGKILRQMVTQSRPVYTNAQALNWSISIAEALEFMHTHDPPIIHRDLKADNVLLSENGGEVIAKLCDLGLHAPLKRKPTGEDDSGQLSYEKMTGTTGTYIYMAPEMLIGQYYNQKVDVFSYGVIIFELFSRHLLGSTYLNSIVWDESLKHAQKVAAGWRPPFPGRVPPAIRKIVEMCWAENPKLRPSMSDVVGMLREVKVTGFPPEYEDKLTGSNECCSIL